MRSVAAIPNKVASDFENELEAIGVEITSSIQNLTATYYEFELDESKVVDLETLITIFQ